VGRHDNFFELGGHSLTAVTLTNLINQKGVHLSLTNVFKQPTVASLSNYCSPQTLQPSTQPAIVLKRGSDESCFFFVHDGTGDLLYAEMLSQKIDSQLTFYGLPSETIEDTTSPTIENLAERMVGMIRDIQPVGPYCIAGWSFGGMLAYEIVLQLISGGGDVEFLGLIDSVYTPAIDRSKENAKDSFDERTLLLEHVQDYLLSEQKNNGWLSTLLLRLNEMDFNAVVRYCQKTSLLPPRFTHQNSAQILRQLRRERRYYLASIKYCPAHMPLPVYLFQALETNISTPSLGWATILNEHQLKMIPVPGNHHSIFQTPNIAVLARALSNAVL
jgi:thioesterase domain-containing protein